MWWLALVACNNVIGVGSVSTPGSAGSGGPNVTDDESPIRWMLHGGGAEDDAVFGRFVEAAGFGDIVTLGALEDTNDPDLRFWDDYFVGLGARSALTINTATSGEAEDAALAEQIAQADGVFVRGGDQGRYVSWWFDGPVGQGLTGAFDRGAVIGGSSAGCAILGERVYDALQGSVDAYELLADAADPAMTFSAGADFGVPGVLTDTHFSERGRLVRLAVFLAAQPTAEQGVGVDPQTALFLREDQTGFVLGDGGVTLMRPAGSASLQAGAAPYLEDVQMWSLPAGYELDLRATDPVVRRPSGLVEPGSAAPGGAFPSGWLDGDDPATSSAGSWRLTRMNDPYAFVDGVIGLEDASAGLPGLVVQGALYEDSDLFETRVGGLLWSLTQHSGAVALGVDVGHRVEVTAPGLLTPAPGSALVVLDARDAAWVAARQTGWQSAALEGVRLSIVDHAHPLDLSRP